MRSACGIRARHGVITCAYGMRTPLSERLEPLAVSLERQTAAPVGAWDILFTGVLLSGCAVTALLLQRPCARR